MKKHNASWIMGFLLLCALSSAFANQDVLSQTFSNKAYHYSIRYPASWTCYDKGKGVVLFKSKMDKPSNQFLVNIQTIFTKKGGGEYVNVKDLMNDFWSQVPQHTQRTHFLDRKPITLIQPDGSPISGEQTTLTFYENGQTLKHWQVMVENQDGLLFQAWAYRAPVQSYEANKPFAEAMLASWVIDPSKAP